MTMGKKNEIELVPGENIILFNDDNEDLSALPRAQRRLRERLREKSRRSELKKFQQSRKIEQAQKSD
jgi:hypothetical protein